MTRDNEVLGTFALYSRDARVSGEEDLTLINAAGHIALIAIERQSIKEALETEKVRNKVWRERLRP